MAKCIYAIDQDRDTLDFLEMVLVAEGYDIITNTSGNDLIAEIRKYQPQLILVGNKVGRRTGTSISKELKLDDFATNIPTILLLETSTTYSSIHHIGADDFLVKPLNINVLLQTVEEYLLAKVIHFVPAHGVFFDQD
ncbi:response regulator [Desertivirga arenae]|uniref:response regulator n=1 Tax=Desertivirga arenae TaxID=2810309 RepID=UPI001A9585DF|nr:response regulator [Pedobacter sp. SYSU D00823]